MTDDHRITEARRIVALTKSFLVLFPDQIHSGDPKFIKISAKCFAGRLAQANNLLSELRGQERIEITEEGETYDPHF
tara:strand:+ start:149 stop:379 length:231 start_codon:yes stop_codon:yes gene_type:complete